jgi:hypothetical protein
MFNWVQFLLTGGLPTRASPSNAGYNIPLQQPRLARLIALYDKSQVVTIDTFMGQWIVFDVTDMCNFKSDLHQARNRPVASAVQQLLQSLLASKWQQYVQVHVCNDMRSKASDAGLLLAQVHQRTRGMPETFFIEQHAIFRTYTKFQNSYNGNRKGSKQGNRGHDYNEGSSLGQAQIWGTLRKVLYWTYFQD